MQRKQKNNYAFLRKIKTAVLYFLQHKNTGEVVLCFFGLNCITTIWRRLCHSLVRSVILFGIVLCGLK